mgnify:CR=1 FL=1
MQTSIFSLLFFFFFISFHYLKREEKKMTDQSTNDEQNRMPKDATVVQKMLLEMGITNYEPKLIPMVLDFMHRELKLHGEIR